MDDSVGKWVPRDFGDSRGPEGWASDAKVYEWREGYDPENAPDDPDLLSELFAENCRVSSGIHFKSYADMDVSVIGGPSGFQPAMQFEDARLQSQVLENIRKQQYKDPTPIQTGSGKTAAFLVPIISTLLTKIKNGRVKPIRQVPGGKPFKASPLALILLPTRELAIQIFDEARRFTYKTNLRPAVVYGGADVRAQVQKMSGGCDILVATAGRLKDMIQRGHVSLSHVRHLVLDEADRMLDMGFGPDIREIVNKSSMPQDEGRQTLMFSATFPREVQILAKDFLKVDYVRLRIGRIGGTTKSIKQRILYVQDPDKRDTLVDILMSQSPTRTLIFMETKRAADSLDDYLFNLKFPTVSIHGDRDQHERESALKAFRDGRSPILIATAVASRGLDIKDVNHVINYELPKDIDDYIHRIGRTARAGNQGLATSFYNDRNELIAPQLTKILQECSQEVPDFLKAYVSENTTYEANDDFVEESDEQILGAGPSSSGAVWNMTEADSNWGSGGW